MPVPPPQPVDHLVVSRLVPLNSSSNLSVQSPATPVGVGARAAGLVDGAWSAHVTATATTIRTAATSSHDRLAVSLNAVKSPGRGSLRRRAGGLAGALYEMGSPWSCVVACAGAGPVSASSLPSAGVRHRRFASSPDPYPGEFLRRDRTAGPGPI
jgi:hypothetical protein